MTTDISKPGEEEGLKYLLRRLTGGFNLATNPFIRLPADLWPYFNCLLHANVQRPLKKYT